MKTGSKLPVLGEIYDSDVSDHDNYVLTYVILEVCVHDIITCDEMGLDSDSWTCGQTDSTTPSADRQQPVLLAAPELTSQGRGGKKTTPPPRGQGTTPPWTGHDHLES
jgi:hypothetical protein